MRIESMTPCCLCLQCLNYIQTTLHVPSLALPGPVCTACGLFPSAAAQEKGALGIHEQPSGNPLPRAMGRGGGKKGWGGWWRSSANAVGGCEEWEPHRELGIPKGDASLSPSSMSKSKPAQHGAPAGAPLAPQPHLAHSWCAGRSCSFICKPASTYE